MNRAERRRIEKQQKKKRPTYHYTDEYLKNKVSGLVQKELNTTRETIMNDAVNQAMLLLFVLPIEVLMDHYWQDCYEEKVPEFTQYLIDYYKDWQDGKLDMEEMKKDLWEYGGVRFEEK